MKHILCALMALALSACGAAGGGIASTGAGIAQVAAGAADAAGAKPPAPLERTTIDEKAVTLAAATVDTLALSLSALSKTPLLVPGTATAQTLARALDGARDGVNAAEAARQAGSATSYTAALNRAQESVAIVKSAIASIMGGKP